MGYIPENARWYLAEIIEEIRIEDEPNNVVHVNFILIEADSPEDAYLKSRQIGKHGETSFENTDGKRVTIRFRGLRDLNVIHDELEHGAEIIYEEKIGLSETELHDLISSKKRLGIFRPLRDSNKPNYMPRYIRDELIEHFSKIDSAEGENKKPARTKNKRTAKN